MSATTIDVFVTSPPVVDVTIVSDPVFEVLGVLPTGPRGPAGDPGAAGEDGASAYDVAVAEGFVGDEAAWLASLIGEQGEPGDPGTPGADGEGVPTGGTTGQVLSKASDDDYDTEWVEQTGGGGSGVVASVVAGTNIDVDATDPANPVVSVEALTAGDISGLSTVATTGAYADLSGKPTLGTAAAAATGDFDPAGAAAAAQAASQPLDSDLTAIAALTTTTYGRALLALADAAAGRTALGLGTAAVEATSAFDAAGSAAAAQAASQPLDSDLTAIAALSTTSYGRSLLAAADAAALRTLAGLGTAATSAATAFVGSTGNETIAGTKTFSSDVVVPDEAYDATAWNGSLEVPTKNAVRDKIETLSAGGSLPTIDDPTAFTAVHGADLGYDQEFDRTGSPTTVPSGWSLFGSPTAYREQFGAGIITHTVGSGSYNWQGMTRAVPSESSYTVTVKLSTTMQNSSAAAPSYQGLLIGDGTKWMSLARHNNNAGAGDFGIYADRWTNSTTYSAAGPVSNQRLGYTTMAAMWLRIKKNSATSYDFSASIDGVSWYPLASAYDISAFLTPSVIGVGASNRVGVAVDTACHWFRVR